MYKIGEFSKLSFLTIPALRHYDETGLLNPARTDASTGYRYYAGKQLPRAHLILALKNLGLTLDEVRSVLGPGAGRTKRIKALLESKRVEWTARVEESRQRLSQVDTLIRRIENDGRFPQYPVVIKKIEAQRAAVLRQVLPEFSGEHIAAMFGELVGFIKSSGAGFAGPTMMVYKDKDYKEQNADIEVAAPIAKLVPEGARVHILELPGYERVAAVTHQGRYETMGDAYAAIMSWVAENGYHIAGDCRELYLVSPADTTDPDKYISEIQIPVAPRQGD